jgi:hypothetical protein
MSAARKYHGGSRWLRKAAHSIAAGKPRETGKSRDSTAFQMLGIRMHHNQAASVLISSTSSRRHQVMNMSVDYDIHSVRALMIHSTPSDCIYQVETKTSTHKFFGGQFISKS